MSNKMLEVGEEVYIHKNAILGDENAHLLGTIAHVKDVDEDGDIHVKEGVYRHTGCGSGYPIVLRTEVWRANTKRVQDILARHE